MTEDEMNWAKDLGKQIDLADNILCPRRCVEGQTMSALGDFEDILWCPHCEIEVRLVVSYSNGR